MHRAKPTQGFTLIELLVVIAVIGILAALLFPVLSYQDFNVFFKILESTLIHWNDTLLLSLYAADFVIIMLLLALWRFRMKELI